MWLGHEALIMPAVSIGDGAIIASRSVVTKNIPPYAIVAGNPAKVIRTRFDEATIANLLEIRWWDMPIEVINKNIAAIIGADIDKLKKISGL